MRSLPNFYTECSTEKVKDLPETKRRPAAFGRRSGVDSGSDAALPLSLLLIYERNQVDDRNFDQLE
jgi:hypothetical protein